MSNLATFLKWINDDLNCEGQELNALVKSTALYSEYSEVKIRCTNEGIYASGIYKLIAQYTCNNEWSSIIKVEFEPLPIDQRLDRPCEIIRDIVVRIQGGEYF